ncbi:hypothetical protein RSO01_91260 [Reyranella soli]|uniref:Uncharacterized protein n=1 Tax=Reyranella soli TaxID=1230389 RepID=A0A512NSN6_9HYPH|nr:hypothetical protein RSO01_91260 [Reyranella soli]
MDRSPKAPLNSQEVTTLQTLKQDRPKRELSRCHYDFILKRLIAEGEELTLSQAGQVRLEADKATSGKESAPACALGVSASGRARAAGCGTTPPSTSTPGPPAALLMQWPA